jgi:hypothetical protein
LSTVKTVGLEFLIGFHTVGCIPKLIQIFQRLLISRFQEAAQGFCYQAQVFPGWVILVLIQQFEVGPRPTTIFRRSGSLAANADRIGSP